MNKRLLLINVALNWGSTGKIVEGIGKLALSNGWEVYVAHGARYKNPSALKSVQVTSKVEEWLHYIESCLFDAQGLGSRFATHCLLKKIDIIKPDIVHIHNIHGCYINYPKLFRYLKERKIPVVWTLHDCWPMTGHCVYFERVSCDKWKTGCAACPQSSICSRPEARASRKAVNSKDSLLKAEKKAEKKAETKTGKIRDTKNEGIDE